jgi:hypothetical protein
MRISSLPLPAREAFRLRSWLAEDHRAAIHPIPKPELKIRLARRASSSILKAFHDD